MRRVRPIPFVVALAVLAIAVAGCGERKESTTPQHAQRVELMLDWVPNADPSAIYAAQANGRCTAVIAPRLPVFQLGWLSTHW